MSQWGKLLAPRALAARLPAGDLKGVLWRLMQDAGGAFGRLVGAGPMLYVVARPAAAGGEGLA